MKKQILFIVWILLALLCLVYGIVVGTVGSGTWFFVVWLGLAVVFALFAIAVKMNLWVRLPGIIRKIFLAVICLGLAFFVVVEGCIISKFHEKGQADLDYIIVLGAQVHENGPSVVLKYRLDRAIAYLEENAGTFCIVSGGQGYNEPFPEAEGMAAYLKEHGVSSERILLETESQTTSQNISNSMAYLQEDASVGIVTNDFHMFRALQTAKSQGLQKVCGISAGSVKRYLMNNMLREFFGEIKFLISDHGSIQEKEDTEVGIFSFLKSVREEKKKGKKYMEMSTEELLELNDLELYNAISLKLQQEERNMDVEEVLAKFTGAKRVSYVVQYYFMEVNNGGLCQYFVNSSRLTAPYILEGLKTIGADPYYEQLKQFIDENQIDLNDLDSFIIEDVDEFETQLGRYPFDEFDDQFYTLEEEYGVEEYLSRYVREHIQEF